MKTILMLAHDDEGQEARLQAALDLTRALGGHLTCLDIAQPPRWVADYVTTAGAMIAFAREETREQANIDRLKERLSAEDVSWDALAAIGDAQPTVVAQAAFADAVVVDCSAEGHRLSDPRSLAAATAAGVHGLVVAVPEQSRGLDLFAPAVVAWDGSMPAAVALARAVPVLQKASWVILLVVGDEELEGQPAEAAARYLSRHGIRAEIQRMAPGSGGIDGAIRDTVRANRAGCVVMGVYGHSPLREALFGGVSRRMLETSEVPLLLGR